MENCAKSVSENDEKTKTKDENVSDSAASAKHIKLTISANSQLVHSLNLTSYLASHASFKSVLIDLMRQHRYLITFLWFISFFYHFLEYFGFFRRPVVNVEIDFSLLLSYLLEILNIPSSKSINQLAQQQVVVIVTFIFHYFLIGWLLYYLFIFQTIIQSLCDHSISLIPDAENETTSNDNETASKMSPIGSLPELDQMLPICAALIKHLSNQNSPYATVLPTLRILLTLCEHDYGVYCIKRYAFIKRLKWRKIYKYSKKLYIYMHYIRTYIIYYVYVIIYTVKQKFVSRLYGKNKVVQTSDAYSIRSIGTLWHCNVWFCE